jgi:hypothetical protein
VAFNGATLSKFRRELQLSFDGTGWPRRDTRRAFAQLTANGATFADR